MIVIPLHRQIFSPKSTIAKLIIPDEGAFCSTIELSTFVPDEKGLLAIRPGTYDLRLDPSPRFGKPMWEIFGVPREDGHGFRSGLLFHSANAASELDGCVAPGRYAPNVPDWIGGSRETYDRLFKRFTELASHGPMKLKVIGWASCE